MDASDHDNMIEEDDDMKRRIVAARKEVGMKKEKRRSPKKEVHPQPGEASEEAVIYGEFAGPTLDLYRMAELIRRKKPSSRINHICRRFAGFVKNAELALTDKDVKVADVGLGIFLSLELANKLKDRVKVSSVNETWKNQFVCAMMEIIDEYQHMETEV